MGLAHAWAAGEDLAEVISDEEISGGDFVRNVKQLIDLVRQLGDHGLEGRPRPRPERPPTASSGGWWRLPRSSAAEPPRLPGSEADPSLASRRATRAVAAIPQKASGPL